MLELFQSAMSKQINNQSKKFLEVVASLEKKNYSELDSVTLQAFANSTFDELLALTDSEVSKFAKENGEILETHYLAIKKSGFNTSLWSKHTEVEEFCGAVVNIFLTNKINSILKK